MKGSNGQWVYSRVSPNEKEKLEFYSQALQGRAPRQEYLTKQWDTRSRFSTKARPG